MSDTDAYEGNMWKLTKLSEEDVDRVLTGRYDGDDVKLRDLADIGRDVKAILIAGPDDTTRATHLVAIGDVAANLDVKRSPVSTPPPSPSPFRRVKVVLTSLLASLVGKIALVSVAVAATTGGLAATGSLPDPAQEALTRVGEKVGIHLPAGGDNEAGVPDELPPSTEGSSAPTVLDVIRSWDDDKGCAFGHAVATAAGGKPGPCNGEQGDLDDESKKGGKPEGAGKPETTPKGKPEGAGKPETTPEGAGKPEGTPQEKPEGAGKPEGTPGGGSNAEERGSRNADHGGSSDGGTVGPPSDPPNNGGNGRNGGPPSSVPSGKP